jgi:hypothetical protein
MGTQVQIVSDFHASLGGRRYRRSCEEAEEGQSLGPVATRRR